MFFSTFLSKITKYNRAHVGGDPAFIQLLGHDPTPRPTCPVYNDKINLIMYACILIIPSRMYAGFENIIT